MTPTKASKLLFLNQPESLLHRFKPRLISSLTSSQCSCTEEVLVETSKVSKERYLKICIVREIKKTNPDILVCTPGRLIDLLKNEGLNLKNVRYQILDEGDKMLDMGFEQDILEIQNHLQKEGVDNMIFSATVPAFI